MELLKTAWISFLSIIVLFLLTKLMGNKQLSQLSMFDYIIEYLSALLPRSAPSRTSIPSV